MNHHDLDRLDALLDQAVAVVPMLDVHDGARDPRIIGLRHDVDNTIEEAVLFARWEAERGYRATYYILHSAPYWNDKALLRRSIDEIAAHGHEIGIHNDAIGEAVREGGTDPRLVLAAAIVELDTYGYPVSGTVAHGAAECYDPQTAALLFVNDEMFVECRRRNMGDADRVVAGVRILPESLAAYGLDYDANWIGRAAYLSDSGGSWSTPDLYATTERFPFPDGQLHLLVHPCHWRAAFSTKGVTA